MRNLMNSARGRTRITIFCEVCESSSFFPNSYFDTRSFGTKEYVQLFMSRKVIPKGVIFFSASRELSASEQLLPKKEKDKLLAVQKSFTRGMRSLALWGFSLLRW